MEGFGFDLGVTADYVNGTPDDGSTDSGVVVGPAFGVTWYMPAGVMELDMSLLSVLPLVLFGVPPALDFSSPDGAHVYSTHVLRAVGSWPVFDLSDLDLPGGLGVLLNFDIGGAVMTHNGTDVFGSDSINNTGGMYMGFGTGPTWTLPLGESAVLSTAAGYEYMYSAWAEDGYTAGHALITHADLVYEVLPEWVALRLRAAYDLRRFNPISSYGASVPSVVHDFQIRTSFIFNLYPLFE
jgi:hypothetical protein